MNICYEGAKYMSKKNVILTITQICVISILVGILVVVIIEKIENEKKNEALQRNHGYAYEESEDIKKLREIIENICRTSEYKPYGKPLIMFAEVLGTSEYKTEYPDYEKFISTEDNVWYCTDCSIDEEYIGEYIGTMTSSNKEEYEIYKINDISSEYAVTFKEAEPDCYMGLINTKEYAPENIQDFIADTNLKNSDVEINMTFTEQSQEGDKIKYGIMTFIDEDEYLWNNFLDNNKYIYVDNDFYYKKCIEEFDIFIFHKTLKIIYKLNINYKGNIEIESKRGYPYEFESTEEAAEKFLKYISENYEGYKEESPVQGPTLGNKNEFTND